MGSIIKTIFLLRLVQTPFSIDLLKGVRSDYNRLIRKVICPHLVFGPLFSPKPLFQWSLQSKERVSNVYSASNAHGLRIIIVVVMEVFKKKERQDETQLRLPQNLMIFCVSTSLNANVFFAKRNFESHPAYNQTQGSRTMFSSLYG